MTKRLLPLIYSILLLMVIIIPIVATPIVIADEETDIVLESLTPQPLNPINGEKDVAVSPVNFTWNRVAGTVRYQIELYSSDDLNNAVFTAKTTNDATGYVYRGTLKYNTTYNWRVIGTDPPGDYSAVSWFTTEKQSTATSTGASGQSSTLDSIKDMDTAMVIGIGIGVLAVILIIVYFALPKKSSPPRPNATRQRGFSGPPPFLCPSCGTENTTGQPFCWDCGSPLPPPGTPPQWGPPMQQPTPAFMSPVCPRCGTPNAPGEKFCSTCGVATPVSASRQQTPPGFGAPRQQPSSMYGDPRMQPPPQNWQQPPQDYTCPGCGSPVPYGRQACPNCGTQILW